MDTQFFVQNIKELCKKKGVKPTIACEESGAGKNFLNHIETRGSKPSVEKVQMLADYLGVTTSELLGEKKAPAAEDSSEREKEFIQLFQKLTPEQQDMILAQLKGVVDSQGN